MANHTTFRIGGAAKYFCVVKSSDEFLAVARAAKENNIPFYILGGGSNLLVADEGFDGLVIKIKNEKLKIKNENEKLKIICEAGVPFAKVILESTRQGYSGAEWGFGIPGTIGGAIFGNAGRLGQSISQVVVSVKILDKDLNEKIISSGECGFSYRESRFKRTCEIILEADLEFQKKDGNSIEELLNKAKQVIKKSPPFPSAGCAFKNHQLKEDDVLLRSYPELSQRVKGGKIGVGYLIEQCGLKGKQIGGAQIWEGHANYIVNIDGAKAKDVLALIKLCKETVKEKFAINLEEEIRFLNG